MIGHGRPASLAWPLARATIAFCACLVGVAAGQNPPPPEPVQLRITWGNGEPTRWTGRVAVDDGSLSNLKLLGTDADAAGSFWLEGGQLHVGTLSAHKVDSFEVTAKSGAIAKLQMELAASDTVMAQRLEVPLAELARHPYQVRLDDRGNTLDIRIIPQPTLQISTNRDPLIYSPGEQCSFEMSAAIANLTPGTALKVQTTLSAARRKEILWSDNQRLAVPVNGHPKIMLNVPLPNAAGVYTIHIAVTRPSGFNRIWAAATPLDERSFQVVVLDQRPPAPAAGARWESVLEIDPTNPRWFERLPGWTQVRRIPGLSYGALGSMRAEAVNLPLGRFIELPPASPGADPHWQAYSLPLEAVGVPHLLEIDYPADSEQHFCISIVEPDATGVISGTNRDAGVYVEGLGRSNAKQKESQRLVFWPRTQAPLLVVANMHPAAAAHFGPIRVLKRNTNQLNASPPSAISRDRLMAAYLARPTITKTFGATQAIDPSTVASGLPLECIDDSQTAYESATRFADYLRYSGYNSAVVNVRDFARSQPSATKPLDVDGLELMLRVFDREGVSLLPALDFSAPLAELEALRRTSGDPRISGLEWVGPDGRTWLEANGNRQGLAPYYNVLDARVQQTMLKLVSDLVERYGKHPAFAGLAIQLSSDGYAQLPPLDWGMDDATVARFARDKGIQLAADIGEKRFAARHALFTGQHADAWRSWRAAQVSAFYTQLASLVRGNGDRRLILTTESVFDHPLLSARVRPKLGHNSDKRVVSTLLDAGIDRQSLERIPGLVLSPTRYVGPTSALPDRALDLELNEAFALSRQPSSAEKSRAASLYHRPLKQRLATFEAARIPWRVSGSMQLVCQPLPHSAAVRQPYAEALAEIDPAVIIDGGELLPLGHEDALREARTTLALLPTAAEVSEIARQPVIVRSYAEPNRITIVAMNMSPWPCDALISVDLPQATTLERIAASKTGDTAPIKSIAMAAGRQSWTAKLAPYEISASRIPIVGAKVVDVQTNLPAEATVELEKKLADLTSRDLSAPHIYPALDNPSFEPIGGAGRLPGWRLAGNDPKASAELDASNPQDGKSCLYLRCEGQSAVIESASFQLPPTGQLAMTVFARGQNLAPTTELRLVVEADSSGQVYRRAARVTAAEMQHPNGQWGRPVAILVNDLPLESRGQMRIAFELTGPGEVWLDNVKLHDLLFATSFYNSAQAEIIQLSQQIHAARSAFDARQITDCIRILDGYWPRFILANRPPVQPKIAEAPAPNNQQGLPAQPDQGQQPTPGIGDRIKRLWQFR